MHRSSCHRLTALCLAALFLFLPVAALGAGEKNVYNLPTGTIEGFDTGADWFGQDFAYDLTDEAACWELLQKPITVLDVGEKEVVYPLTEPGGKKVVNEWMGGTINGSLAAVHVLGEDEDGWTKIEGLDYYNRVIRGYVKTKLLKTVTPNARMGIIVDKLTQRLNVFIDGKFWSSCAVSTGLVNKEQPYNETAAGEYLIGSWVGGFDSEGMYCEMAIRFNGGDMFHQVPYVTLADGTKRFTKYEALLGEKASHGCIRVARTPNEDGLCIKWLWDNLKKGTKVLVWDDHGRSIPYPDDSLELFYNPDGGSYYHANANCGSVRDKYLPLTAFSYGELDTGAFAKLDPCPSCTPAKRKAIIDEQNKARGAVTPGQAGAAETEQPPAETEQPPADAAEPTAEPEATQTPSPEPQENSAEEVVIVIRD